MKKKKDLQFYEKLANIGVFVIYPFALLFGKLGRLFKRLSKKQQQILAGTLSLIMIASMLLPTMSAFAVTTSVSVGDLTLTGDNPTAGTDYSYAGNQLTILSDKEMTISGTTTTDHIVVGNGTDTLTANLTLDNMNVQASGVVAFTVSEKVNLYLTLVNENSMQTNNVYYGTNFDIRNGSTLTFTKESTGTLSSPYVSQGGGIKAEGATVNILGGTVNSSFGPNANHALAADKLNISGGKFISHADGTYGPSVKANSVKISGGAVKIANGNSYSLVSDSIEITGGSVSLSRWENQPVMSSTPTDGKGNTVYLTTVALENVETETPVSTIAEVGSYGLSDVKTDASGKLYFWLPVDTEVTYATTDTLEYHGSVKTTADNTASGTLDALRTYDLTVTGGVKGVDYTYSRNTLTILTSTAMTISGTTTIDHIVVGNGTDMLTANLTLDNMNVQASGVVAFTVSEKVNLYLTLANENSTQTNNVYFGSNFEVKSGSTLTFTEESTGTLNSPSVYLGGGIKAEGSTVNILGGTVVSAFGTNANQALTADKLNISGGNFISLANGTNAPTVKANSIKISGGTVKISNGKSYPFESNSIEITGGSVSLSRWENQPVMSSTPTDGKGNNVYLTTVALKDVAAETPVSSVENIGSYGLSDVETDANGKLYFWLPVDTEVNYAATDTLDYQGSVKTTADNTASGTLEAVTYDLTVTGGVKDVDYTYFRNTLTILTSTAMTISGTTMTDHVVVGNGTDTLTANLTLDNMNVQASGVVAFTVSENVNLYLTLVNENRTKTNNVTWGSNFEVKSGSTVTFTKESTGTLNSPYVYLGGGIKAEGATVNILGGTVNTARGGNTNIAIIADKLNISGGKFISHADGTYGPSVKANSVKISGGTVAIKNDDSYSIESDSIEITGGSVSLSRGENQPVMSSTPTDGNGNTVYLTTVALENVTAETPVSTITGLESYGLSDVKTDASGKLYFWLPVNTEATYAVADMLEYRGSVKTTADNTASGTLGAVVYGLTVTGGVKGVDYTYLINALTILTSTPMTISGSTTTDRIAVRKSPDNLPTNLTLDNVNVQVSNKIAFTVYKDTNLNLTLVNENSTQTNNINYGTNFDIRDGSTVTFTKESTGTLTIPYVYSGGGIKAGGATVNILGGTVVSSFGPNANQALTADKLNISGGKFISHADGTYGPSVKANSIKISGGTVKISNGSSYSLESNSIEITGGSVSLSRWQNQPVMSSTPTDGKGNNVYLTTLTMNGDSGVLASTAFASMEVKDLAYTYGFTDVVTDDKGKLYVYLPENKTIVSIKDQNTTYVGEVTLQSDKTSIGSFAPAVAPVITTQALTNATNILNYSVQLEATGNPSDFVWEIISGTLPEGMTLSEDGVLSGKPVGSGDFVFTVSASNGIGEAATKQFTLTVDPSYLITIPAETTLGTTEYEVKAENVMLPEGKQLEVTLTSTSGENNAFTLSTANGASIAYTAICNEKILAIGDNVLTVAPEVSSTGSALITFTEPTNKQFAGTYTGTVTFMVSVADAN